MLWTSLIPGRSVALCCRLSDRNLARMLDKAAKSVGLAGVSHHMLRHTHGSVLLDQGWTIPEVSERLGHADPVITAKVYAHKLWGRRRDLSFLDEPDRSTSREAVEAVGETEGEA